MQNFVRRLVPLGAGRIDGETIHVVFGVDRNYGRPLGIMLTSVLEHNENVAAHIFADELQEDDLERLRRLAWKHDTFCTWYQVDATSVTAFPTTFQWSTATYFRFLAGEYLSRRVERILYLDSDMLCIGPLSELYHVAMKGKGVAAVLDSGLPPERLQRIGHAGDGYFNAGMLVMDIAYWRENHIFARAMGLLREHPERYEALDQDVLNLLYSDAVLWVNARWNQSSNEKDEYPAGTKIIHYTGTPKPWLEWYYCSGENFYEKTRLRSEWKDVPLISEPRTIREVRLMSRASFQRGEMVKGICWYGRYLKRKLIG